MRRGGRRGTPGGAAGVSCSVWWGRAEELSSCPLPGVHVRGHCELRAGRRMMTMNGKQHFSMHPALHEPKYPGLHSGSEGMRRVCLPAPQVRSGRGVRGGEDYHTGNVCKVDLTGLCSLSALSLSFSPSLLLSLLCVPPPPPQPPSSPTSPLIHMSIQAMLFLSY